MSEPELLRDVLVRSASGEQIRTRAAVHQTSKRVNLETEPNGCLWVHTPGSILVPEVRAVVITVGLRLRSQAQWSNNWRAAYGRSQQLRKRVMHALARVDVEHVIRHLQGPPARILFVRLAPRLLDTDNLAAAFKPIRDQVCCWLACDNTPTARANDGMRSGYSFEYRQQQQRAYGIRVELSRGASSATTETLAEAAGDWRPML